MILRYLKAEDEAETLLAHKEFEADQWGYLLNHEPGISWSEFIQRLDNERLGIDLAPGRVRASFYIAEVDGKQVGRSSIRHSLNDFLFNVGGHIGYGVRPAFRGLGYATQILELSLGIIRDLGVTDVLVTCDDDNFASARVIEKCGGVIENKVEFEGSLKRRYWIHQE